MSIDDEPRRTNEIEDTATKDIEGYAVLSMGAHHRDDLVILEEQESLEVIHSRFVAKEKAIYSLRLYNRSVFDDYTKSLEEKGINHDVRIVGNPLDL